MLKDFFSTVDMRSTLIFFGVRIACTSIVLILFMLLTVMFSQSNEGLAFGVLIQTPFTVIVIAILTFLTAYLSQLGVPYTGLLSIIFSIPFKAGDILVWLIHKKNPEWIPVDNPDIFNPPIVWVTK